MAAQRFPTQEKALIELYGKPGSVLANVRNVSTTGTCVELIQSGLSIEKGDLVRVAIELPALNKTLKFSAEVIWTKGNVRGLSFLGSEQFFERVIKKL